MTDRVIVYPYEGVQDVDILNTNKNAMVGLGYALQAILGTATLVDGLACTPTLPASLSVLVSTGSIYSLQNIDASAYGTLAADTANQVVKQGIVVGNTTFSCPAPGTSGQSRVYLVQAQHQDIDGGSASEPFVNSSDGTQYFQTVNTVRKGVCVLAIKAGVAATTGTQATPTPDAGYTGLYAITVANGQTTITSGNIARVAGAPFIDAKLVGKLNAASNLSDLGNAASALTNLGALAVAANLSDVASAAAARANLSAAASGANSDIGSLLACDLVKTSGAGASFSILTDQYIDCTNRAGSAFVNVRGLAAANSSHFVNLGQFLTNNVSPGYMGIPVWTGGAVSKIYVQWGFNTIPSSSTYALTFPIAFPNNCFIVLATQQTAGTPASFVSTGAPGTTGVTFYPSNGTLSNGFYWLALGN